MLSLIMLSGTFKLAPPLFSHSAFSPGRPATVPRSPLLGVTRNVPSDEPERGNSPVRLCPVAIPFGATPLESAHRNQMTLSAAE